MFRQAKEIQWRLAYGSVSPLVCKLLFLRPVSKELPT